MENSQTQHQTKPYVVVTVVGVVPVTNRTPEVIGIVVPGTAASCTDPAVKLEENYGNCKLVSVDGERDNFHEQIDIVLIGTTIGAKSET